MLNTDAVQQLMAERCFSCGEIKVILQTVRGKVHPDTRSGTKTIFSERAHSLESSQSGSTHNTSSRQSNIVMVRGDQQICFWKCVRVTKNMYIWGRANNGNLAVDALAE